MQANGVYMKVTNPGSGNFVMDPVTGHPTLNQAFPVHGTPVDYVVATDEDPPKFVGAGSGYTAASNTITNRSNRASYASSAYDNTSSTPMNLMGTYRVFVTHHAASLRGRPYGFLSAAPNKLSHLLGFTPDGTSTFTLSSANVGYGICGIPSRGGLSSGITFRVTTLQSASRARCGIWLPRNNDTPILIKETVDVACTTTGIKNATWQGGGNFDIPHDEVIIAIMTDVAGVAVQGYSNGGMLHGRDGSCFGTDANGTPYYRATFTDSSGWTVMPASPTFNAFTQAVTAGAPCLMFLHAS